MSARVPERLRVLIHGPPKRRDALVGGLRSVGVDAIAASERLRTALWQVFSVNIVQRTLHIAVDYPKSAKVFALARLMGKRTVRLWVGTDVLLALQDPEIRRRASALNRWTDLNITVAPHLCDELREIGIRCIPLPPPQERLDVPEMPTFPEQFAVLTYTRDGCDDLYRIADVMELAGMFPDVRFLIVGGTARESERANVEFLGTVSDMEGIYARTSVLLRLVQHDGLPRMVLEALARGRPVLYNGPHPHCVLVETVEEAAKALGELRTALRPNEAGREYVLKTFGGDRPARAWAEAYRTLLTPRGAERLIESVADGGPSAEGAQP
jgi:hypothetical protein